MGKGLLFYKDNFILTDNAEESDVGFLPMTLNYYIKYNQLYEVDKIADHLMSLEISFHLIGGSIHKV